MSLALALTSFLSLRGTAKALYLLAQDMGHLLGGPRDMGRSPAVGGALSPGCHPAVGTSHQGTLQGHLQGSRGGAAAPVLAKHLAKGPRSKILGRGAHIEQLLAINLSALAHHRVRSGSQRPPVTAGGVLACCGHLATPGDTSVGGRCLHATPSLGGDGVRRGRGGGGEEGGEREGEGGEGSASSSQQVLSPRVPAPWGREHREPCEATLPVIEYSIFEITLRN